MINYLKLALLQMIILLAVLIYFEVKDRIEHSERLGHSSLYEQKEPAVPPISRNPDDHTTRYVGDINLLTFTANFDCKPEEVSTAYGKKFAIFADDHDVCSWEYAGKMNFSRPRKPVYQDLSDNAGWPYVHVKSGTVAIDPVSGRFKFAEGDTESKIERVNFCPTPHGFVHGLFVKGNYLMIGNGETYSGFKVIDISDTSNPQTVSTEDPGCFGKDPFVSGDRAYALASYNGITAIDISNLPETKVLGRYRVPPPSNHGSRVVGFDNYIYCYVTPEGNWKDWPFPPNKSPESREVVIDRKWKYAIEGGAVIAFDVSKNPQDEVGRLQLPGEATSLIVAPNKDYLYVCLDRKTLAVVEILEPATLKLVGTGGEGVIRNGAIVGITMPPKATGRPPYHFWISSLAVHIAEYDSIPDKPGIVTHIYDVSDPIRPKFVRDYIFQREGLRLVDFTDPANPKEKMLEDGIPLFDFIEDGVAYSIGGDRYNILETWSVKDPARPVKLGSLDVGKQIADASLVGKKIYFMERQKSLAVIDVSNPAAPKVIARASDEVIRSGGVAISGRYAYVVDAGLTNTTEFVQDLIKIFDIGDLANIKLSGTFGLNRAKPRGGMLAHEKRLYIPDSDYGVWIIDITKPLKPNVASLYYAMGESQHLLVSDNEQWGALSLQWGGMEALIDFSNPTRPEMRGVYRPGKLDNFAQLVTGHYLYFNGRIVDVSDMEHPKEVGKLEDSATIPTRQLWNGLGYIIGHHKDWESGTRGVLVYDCSSDPFHPKLLGSMPFPKGVYGGTHSVTDGKLLITIGDGSAVAVDVSDPLAMKFLGLYNHPDLKGGRYNVSQGAGRRYALGHGYLYQLKGDEDTDDPRLVVIDVRNPEQMKVVYITPETRPTFQDDWFDNRLLHQGDMITDVVLEGRYMYVCDYWGGVRVYDLIIPSSPELVDWEFEPYLELVPETWSREEYKNAVASGKLHKYLGITPEKWTKRYEIGRKLSWEPMFYYPGYELFGWNIGELMGDHLVQPKLGGLAVYKLKRSSEIPFGKVSVRYY